MSGADAPLTTASAVALRVHTIVPGAGALTRGVGDALELGGENGRGRKTLTEPEIREVHDPLSGARAKLYEFEVGTHVASATE